MAYNLCTSPTPLYHQPFFHSPSSTSLKNPNSASFHIRPTLQVTAAITHVTTQGTVSNEEDSNFEYPERKGGSLSKSNVWVNPRSVRASKLRQKSYDARYATLVNVAESLNSCNPSENDVFEVLNGLGGKIVEQDAVVVINNVSISDVALIALKYFLERISFDREVVVYNVTLKVCRKCRDFGKAEKLFDEMTERGVKPDNITFSTIISCARMANLPEKAIEWFEKMSNFGLSPDDITFSAMIDAYGRAGNVEMALSLYDRARTEKWRIDAVTFSTLIKVYGLSKNFDGCLNVYEEMKALGCKPNSVVYNTLLDAMGRAKRPWQAKRIYKDMTNSGISPNFATYAALLRAFGRARYGEDAIKIYKEMKEKKLELNVILYNTVLAMCADLGFDDIAAEIFDDMKSSGVSPDSWSFSSMITIYSCSGKVSEAENMLNEMSEAGFEPNIFVLTSLIQCYGKAERTDDVVKTFNRLLEFNIIPDERFCGCLLNVMTQTRKEELGKLIDCIERANPKLGYTVKLLVEEQAENFMKEITELLEFIGKEVRKAYCNCLIDLCVNLNLLETACELLQLGLSMEIYKDVHSRSETQWSLHLKSLSIGAALTALHVWVNDLTKAMDSGEELPPILGINTGHGKHKFSDKGLSYVLESHLKEINAPFHEATDKVGWFLTTKVATESWLESRKASAAATS